MRRAAARTAPRFLFHPNDKQDHAAAESHPALKTATVPRRERPAALFPNLCFAALGVSLPFWPCTVSYKDCRSPGRTSSCHRRGLQGALPTAPPGTHQDRLLMPLFFFSANLSALDRVLPLPPPLKASLCSSQGVRSTCHRAMQPRAMAVDRPAVLKLVHATASTRRMRRYEPTATSAAATNSPLQVRLHSSPSRFKKCQ